MQGIYPEYADRVNFYAVSYDAFLDLATLDAHGKEADWPWPVTMPVGTMLRDQEVAIWATKIAFNSEGVITYRAGPGEGTDEEFRSVLEELATSG